MSISLPTTLRIRDVERIVVDVLSTARYSRESGDNDRNSPTTNTITSAGSADSHCDSLGRGITRPSYPLAPAVQLVP